MTFSNTPSSAFDAPGLFIGGKLEPGAQGTYEVRNPARPEEVVLRVPSASMEQLDAAVAAARRAHPAWAALTLAERFEALSKAAEAVSAAVAERKLAELLTRENGKVLWEAQIDTGTFGGMVGAFAPLVERALASRAVGGISFAQAGPGPGSVVERVPYGVVAALVPFNWPVSVLGNKLLPALLAGNAVVAKPPPSCPGAVLEVVAVLGEALPEGLVNVVSGPGPELGEALVAHPGVDMVTFTGGVATGRAVMATAARATKPVVLELGGNDPAIVAPDVEIDAGLASKIAEGAFVTSGQVCMAIKRLYVPEARLRDMVDALVERLSVEVVGDGLAEEVTMGPVHTARARERVETMISEALSAGAGVHRAGRVREDDADRGGYFVVPAVVEAPPDSASIVAEEQFAPALPVLGYRDLDEAVSRANDTEYGLCASVWSNDQELASAVARRLEAGTVFVNSHGIGAMDHLVPFGGWKASGLGEELGEEGMAAFTRVRVVRGLASASEPGAKEVV